MNDNMLYSLKQLNDALINFKINYFNQNSYFYFFDENFNDEFDNIIKENFKNSNMIVIDRFYDENYIIMGFYQTIIIFNHNIILNFKELFLNTNKCICFFDKSIKSSFQDEKIMFTESILSYDMLKKINDLSKLLSPKIKIVTHFPSGKLFLTIKHFISRYLISESYIETIKDRYNAKLINKSLNTDESEYIYLDFLGAGSCFQVNLVYNIKTKQLLAKKILRQGEDQHYLIRESENYAKILHPLIPKYFGTNQKNSSMIIEYINGQTLLSFIEKKLFEKKDKIYIILQIMLIIEFLHLKKYVIRDLKPDNIMIDIYKTIVFIDHDKLISYDEIINYTEHSNDFSSNYVCPDINLNNISYKCDIYSLGKLIFLSIMVKLL